MGSRRSISASTPTAPCSPSWPGHEVVTPTKPENSEWTCVHITCCDQYLSFRNDVRNEFGLAATRSVISIPYYSERGDQLINICDLRTLIIFLFLRLSFTSCARLDIGARSFSCTRAQSLLGFYRRQNISYR